MTHALQPPLAENSPPVPRAIMLNPTSTFMIKWRSSTELYARAKSHFDSRAQLWVTCFHAWNIEACRCVDPLSEYAHFQNYD